MKAWKVGDKAEHEMGNWYSCECEREGEGIELDIAFPSPSVLNVY